MSAKTRAYEAVSKSVFNFKPNNKIEILDAVIFWPNFRGESVKYNSKVRSFNLAITEELAPILHEQGWRVREVKLNNADEFSEKLYFVNIKVNFNSPIPPTITLYTEYRGKRSRQTIDVDTVADLDRVIIASADCIVNAYESKSFPGKVTGYLKKLNIIQEPDVEFGGKYDDWLQESDPDDDKLDDIFEE